MLGPVDIEDWLSGEQDYKALADLRANPLVRDICIPSSDAARLADYGLKYLASALIGGQDLFQPQIEQLTEGLLEIENHLTPAPWMH